MSVIMALDSQNLPLKLRERVEITHIYVYMLENANLMKREVRLRLVLRWYLFFTQISGAYKVGAY